MVATSIEARPAPEKADSIAKAAMDRAAPGGMSGFGSTSTTGFPSSGQTVTSAENSLPQVLHRFTEFDAGADEFAMGESM